jgi:AcrR family transcriptional regulator
MDDVAAAAHLSKGGLYFHFKSKDELMVAVVRQVNVLVESFLEAAKEWKDPIPQQIQKLLALYFGYLTLHEDEARLNQCVLDEALRNEVVTNVLHSGEDLFLSHFRTLLARAQQNGEIAPNVDLDIAIRSIMIVIEGVKTKWLHFRDWPWPALLTQTQRLIIQGILGLAPPR